MVALMVVCCGEDSCKCNLGAECGDDTTKPCGPGLFCKAPDPEAAPDPDWSVQPKCLMLAAVLSGGLQRLTCPSVDASGTAPDLMPPLAPPGCPCNYTAHAAHNACPAGFLCSRQAVLAIPNDFYFEPGWQQMQAVCTPCLRGEYCPQGSVYAGQGNFACPEGSYCPTPAERHDCPGGAYCPPMSALPINCTFNE
ncbi:hypothetical protein GPECTOR_48g404 [Gonium pectorale]|uniref:Uncharacterized protein n=1 Tax=Gonium pectorale TaxID=33097 RepID=A0A150G7Z8_GONPE|nr:hypothetical protein GPECTOR_48g404 [Gonium pectorale]|eukprot:KXZ45972.1 hypothetical protein GPECTOR_48g404 [Gonium pectorale]